VLTQLHVGNYFQHELVRVDVLGARPRDPRSSCGARSRSSRSRSTPRSAGARRGSVEAAEIDGARPWRVFLDVTLPILRPVLLILTSLSILWDFGVFTQPYLLIGQAHTQSQQLPDGDLSLRRGLPEGGLRARRGDLAADARHWWPR